MRGIEMPVNVIVVVVIIALVALAVIGFFILGFNPAGESIGMEAKKSSACMMWCNSKAKAASITVEGNTTASVICGKYGDTNCESVCNCARKED